MIDDCISKLLELGQHCQKVNGMTPVMHEEFEKTLIELLQHSVIDNHRALQGIRKLKNELAQVRMERDSLKNRRPGLRKSR